MSAYTEVQPMAVVSNLEMVVATKAQLQKAIENSGLSYFPPPDSIAGTSAMAVVWANLAEADLLQSVAVEVDLAVAVNFNE